MSEVLERGFQIFLYTYYILDTAALQLLTFLILITIYADFWTTELK